MICVPTTFIMGFDFTKTDNISGASEILSRTAEYWIDDIASMQPSSVRRALTTIRHRGLFIIQLYPRMAPLFHLVNRVLLSCNQAASVDELKQNAHAEIELSLKDLEKAKSALIPFARNLLASGSHVFIYSRSGVVLSILKNLHREGLEISVLTTEARPAHEGLRVAEELLREKIKVELFVDAAMQDAVAMCDCVLIGADTFSNEIVVNKIGTTALALLAREHKKPVYCFTTMNKYVPPEFKQPSEKDHEASEVWPGAPAGVHIHNKYFENTPMHLLKNVITEAGYFDADNQSPGKKYHIDEWLRDQL